MGKCAWTHGPSKEYCQFCLVYGCSDRVDFTPLSVSTTWEGVQPIQGFKEGVFLTPQEIEAVRNLMKWYWKIYNAIDGISNEELFAINKQLFSVEKKIKSKQDEENNVQ